ncbi:MAG: hypothetical protein A3H97_20465 [Acidobacteria bacterium RIFCSPLOWO2_02_FULL_65_29]|nr:MAG: hypothetical protein A3H97_20465 [Acidobacteria bacterium RIFCSPLOWO2_02_FULL_65_29]
MSRFTLVCGLSTLLVSAVLLQPSVSSQAPAPTRTAEFLKQRAEDFTKRSNALEASGLAQPFQGITANGQVESGLFAIRSTGVSTEPVRKAADTFLAALTKPQRDKTVFGVDDPEWRRWMNQDFYIRQGVSFLEMTEVQRDVAIGLLRASLSAKGLKQTRDIMRLNHTLGELNENDFDRYGEWRYHITVMGTPSASEPWGWQLDGHHAIINYFVLGDQVAMTPVFAGSEPVTAQAGRFKGTTVLQDEQGAGVALVNALTADQRRKAILRVSKTGNENLTEAWKDNVVLDYAGLRVSEMTDRQRQQLLDLVALYINNMDDGHARVKMDEVRRHLDRTWFAWVGATGPEGVFYYRVHSPSVLIEFDHQVPANLRQYAKDPNAPNHEHIHTVVRTPNGNDYGKDLLRLHYAQHPHSTAQP